MKIPTNKSQPFMRLLVAVVLIFAGNSFAQSEPAKQVATKASCVILSSVKPATGMATWSAEGRRRKHTLTYLAGDYPPGVRLRSSINDQEVDKVKAKGAAFSFWTLTTRARIWKRRNKPAKTRRESQQNEIWRCRHSDTSPATRQSVDRLLTNKTYGYVMDVICIKMGALS
jgi:hypothetical protein